MIYGNPETTTGGRALKFYASVRIDIRKGQPIKDGTEVIGNRTKCKVVKNKVAPPFRVAEFDVLYGKGISKMSEIIDMGVQLDIINKSGSWFYYNEERVAQGRDRAREYLEQNPALAAEIEEKIKAKAGELHFEEPEGAMSDGEDGGVVVTEEFNEE